MTSDPIGNAIYIDLRWPFVLIAIAFFACLVDWKALSRRIIHSKDISQDDSYYETLTPSEATVLVTLVHGTFARGSEWTKPHSVIRKKIGEKLGERIHISVFKWSGLNSFGARKNAAKKLAVHLTEVAADHSVPQFVIAHSHGGNVALDALSIVGTLDPTIRLICLSTPFLIASRVSIPPLLKRVPLIIHAFLGLAMPFLFTYWVTRLEIFRSLSASAGTAEVAKFIIFLISVIVCGFLSIILNGRAIRFFDQIKCDISRVSPKSDDVLIFRQPGDEASALLSAAHFAGWCTAVTLGVVFATIDFFIAGCQRCKDSVVRLIATSLAIIVFIVLTYIFVSQNAASEKMDEDYFNLLLVLVTTAIVLFGPFFIIIFLAITLVISFVAMTIPASLAMGWELLLVGPTLKVTAEAAPLGTWKIITIQPHDGGKKRMSVRSLTHSLLCEDEKCIDEMVAWIKYVLSWQGARINH
jgi:hypothetical protein